MDKKMKKIVFCGGGNMAEGILRGLIQNHTVTSTQIAVKELRQERCDYLHETYGITAATDPLDEIKSCDMLIVATLPHQVESAAKATAPFLAKDAIVMSIACGVTLASLESFFDEERKILRMMPNTLSQTGSGYSAACVNSYINEIDKKFITEILDGLGQTMYIEEPMFDTFTAYCCTAPLWLYKMVETMIDAGVYAGFNRTDARRMTLKSMEGVAQLLEMTGAHPAVKVDEMTSPGGVTIEAYRTMQEKGFSAALMETIIAAVNKANGIQ